MKSLKSMFLVLVMAVLASCGGGGGGSNVSGTVYYNHAELADIFVERLWEDLGIDAELVKTDTLQYDYIVVYDYDLDSYDAYYIGEYNPGESLSNYLDFYDDDFVFDLFDNNDGTYSGYDIDNFYVTFDQDSYSQDPADQRVAKAYKEQAERFKVASRLEKKYGFNPTVSMRIVKATESFRVSKIQSGGNIANPAMTTAAKELFNAALGVDVDAAQAALLSGDQAQIEDQFSIMSDSLGGIGKENVRAFFYDLQNTSEEELSFK
ncbi:MAG: hypothetical protein ACPGJV_00015 [Bacteriovoracaceae bacterium]